MLVRLDQTQVRIEAPAKINWYLEILGKRADGFHEIETLMLKIQLYDTIVFEADDSDELRFEVRPALGWRCIAEIMDEMRGIPDNRENLAFRALELVQSGMQHRRGGKLTLIKRIPSGAGLGGGSSDAAAALVAANLGWKLELSQQTLMGFAAQLGSDVPFFLHPSPAICRGRGELVSTVDIVGKPALMVVKPPIELSTAAVYQACRPLGQPQRLTLDRRAALHHVPMLNRLSEAAVELAPEIMNIRESLRTLGVSCHQLTGSGSAYFAVFENRRLARRVANQIRQKLVGQVFCTDTCK